MKAFIVPVLLLLVSCASSPSRTWYNVSVDSLSAPGSAKHVTFSMLSDEADLRSQEFGQLVAAGLQKQGYVQASKKDAKLLIKLSYSISSPITSTSSRTVPIYGQKTATVNNGWGQQIGTVQSWGVQGNRTITETNTKYKREVLVQAFDKKGKAMWETRIVSTGYSSDLREAFPYMVTAAVGKFGKNTGRAEELKVYEDDPNVVRTPASN